jgi:hypothetical protein
MIDARYFSSAPQAMPGSMMIARANAANALSRRFGAEPDFRLRVDDAGEDINTVGN